MDKTPAVANNDKKKAGTSSLKSNNNIIDASSPSKAKEMRTLVGHQARQKQNDKKNAAEKERSQKQLQT
jgi:hypothetical protein